MRGTAALVLLAHLGMLGCSFPPTAERSAASATRTFESTIYGFAITYPAGLEATSTFEGSYLESGGWKASAGPDEGEGTPVLALVMPGSDQITAGALRIGQSREAAGLASCTEVPAAFADSAGRTVIDGTAFTIFDGRDAAMSHHLATKSYRTVHDGACYAIDVIVTGTSPEVYDPPAIPPFTQAEAFAVLTPVMEGFRFLPRDGREANRARRGQGPMPVPGG
jgi:hypothetical protein